MSISVVLRLSPAALAEGRLAGEVLLPQTGERTVVAKADELVAFVLARLPVVPVPPADPRRSS